MFKLGNILVDDGASLAPMAGVSDLAFRDLCKSFNASFVVSEMVSGKALVMGDKKTPNLMKVSEGTRPFGIQVFGNEPLTIGLACQIIEQYNPDFIDLNCGCPAPKITNNKGGSDLLNTPELIYDIIKKMKDFTDKPITAKIRIGFTNDNINGLEVAKIVEKAGADMITVHGRTREQMYKQNVDYAIIKQIKENVSIPVIANGDVDSLESFLKVKEYTGADGIMIGRGALGNPWIFNEIYNYVVNGIILPSPSLEEKLATMQLHMEMLCKDKGEYVGMKEARKHCGWYMKGLNGANNFRRVCGTLKSLADLEELILNVKEFNKI